MSDNRIKCAALNEKVMSGVDAAKIIKSDMVIAFGGFSTGFPKVLPIEIAKQGTAQNLTLLCGAALGPQLFGPLATSGQVTRFSAFQFDPYLKGAINAGAIAYDDVHLGLFPEKIRQGMFGDVNVSVIECAGINADGGIIPSVSIGPNNALFECSDKIILEVNTTIPLGFEGIHDVTKRHAKILSAASERVGETVYRCDLDKIAAIVITDIPETEWPYRPINDIYRGIAKGVVECLRADVASGRLPEDFTMQVGVGGVANAVLAGIKECGFKGLKMFTEVFSVDACMGLLEGLFSEASTTCLDCKSCTDMVYENLDFFRDRLVIRPMEMTNGGANILSMNLVAMNTAVEADIYGNINSTHQLGTDMIYGVGGSNDFARNAKLTVFITPSTAKGGAISSIVPMCSHVDNTEHDVDVIVTEYGWADLRGLSPKQRAAKIIGNCAHPDYRKQLWDYYNGAVEKCGPVQTPHDLEKALSFHTRFKNTGTMKES